MHIPRIGWIAIMEIGQIIQDAAPREMLEQRSERMSKFLKDVQVA